MERPLTKFWNLMNAGSYGKNIIFKLLTLKNYATHLPYRDAPLSCWYTKEM